MSTSPAASPDPLRRDLGTLESYAAMVGILIGAGIFRVTSEAWQTTGSSVILGYLVLALPLWATSVAYQVFVSTSLGRTPGGEYSHLRATFGSPGLAYLGAWLKIISYLGALAFLSNALADYALQLSGAEVTNGRRELVACGALLFFFGVHVVGVRWFGRLQVLMFCVLAVSIAVLVLPGLFAIRPGNFAPFFSGGATGFIGALPALFFAYAGFESLAHAAGEVRDSRRRLPRVFFRGIVATTAIFVAMSAVTFGVLPGQRLASTTTPMADVAAVYLPSSAAMLVSLGATMALCTSLNSTMLVPSRLAFMLSGDGLMPAWIGAVHPRTGTPVVGLALTLAAATTLLLTGQIGVALGIAVQALVILYVLHSYALWVLPRRRPDLLEEAAGAPSRGTQRVAAALSMSTLGVLVLTQVVQDAGVMLSDVPLARWRGQGPTSTELLVGWAAVGALLYRLSRPRG